MWFLVGGVLLSVLWLADVSPFSELHWAWLALPFALAAAWWAFADSTGWTQRRATEKMEARKIARRERDMEALGLTARRQKHRVRVIRDAARRAEPPPPPPPAPPPAEPPRRDPRL